MADETTETGEQTELEKPEEHQPAEIAVNDVHTLDDAALDARLAEEEEERTHAAEEVETPEIPAAEVKTEVADPEEVARLAKQTADKEAFIQRQAAEIGGLRKQAEILRQQLESVNPEAISEQYYENPAEAVNQVLAIREQQSRLQNIEQQAAMKENEGLTKAYVPDFDNLIDDISETLAEMKFAPEAIRDFKINPYETHASVLVNLAERARLSKENKALKAEIETLKKAPDLALKKVEQAARQVITSATGKPGAKGILAKPQIANMSTAEIEAALNEPD